MGLTTLGLFHTAISLVALVAGAVALIRDKRISSTNQIGRLYVIATAITCVTALGIFQHGGFGKPHQLAIITLAVLAFAAFAEYARPFRTASRHVAAVSYSATFLFHWIPAVTETTTRLPPGHPLFANAEAPGLQVVSGVLLLLFIIGAALQVRHLRAEQVPSLAT